MKNAQIQTGIERALPSRVVQRVVALQRIENDLRRAQLALQRASESTRAAKQGESSHLTGALASATAARSQTLNELESMEVPEMPIKVGFRTDFDRSHTLTLNTGSSMCTMDSAALRPFQMMRSPFDCRIADVATILVQAQKLGWESEIDMLIRTMHPGCEPANGQKLTDRILREPWIVLDFSRSWSTDLATCVRFCERVGTSVANSPESDVATEEATSDASSAQHERYR